MKKVKQWIQKSKNRRKFPKLPISADGYIVGKIGYAYNPTKGWKRMSIRDNRFNLTLFIINSLRRRGT